MKHFFLSIALVLPFVFSCKKEGCTDPQATNYNSEAKKDNGSCTFLEEEPYLIVKIHFDSLQPRLDNLGQPATIPAEHSAQSPIFQGLSAHYLELAETKYTALGAGKIVYRGAETTAGGDNACDFSKAVVKGNNEVFVKIPLKDIAKGNYEWLRVSVTYQNYDIKFRAAGMMNVGRLASFVGWNTYISSYKIKQETKTLNSNKLQGYWGFETNILGTNYTYEGQAAGTTVVNPLFDTSPVPAGSCIVTGQFINASGTATPLVITGNEKSNIEMTLSFSVNKSFEWFDKDQDGYFDPNDGDYPVDMGLRGVQVVVK